MKVRSRRRHRLHLHFDEVSEYLESDKDLLGSDESLRPQDELIMAKESCERIIDQVENLPQIYQEVFIMRDVYGYSIRETSKMLQTSHAAVKSRLHRSRYFMKKELAEHTL